MAIAAAQAIIFTFNVCVKTTRNPKSSTTRASAAAVANAARPATTAASALPIWPRLPLGCCFSSSWWCNRRHCCCAAALRLPRRKRTSSAVSPVHRSSSNQQVFLTQRGRSVGDGAVVTSAGRLPVPRPFVAPFNASLSLSLSLSRHALAAIARSMLTFALASFFGRSSFWVNGVGRSTGNHEIY